MVEPRAVDERTIALLPSIPMGAVLQDALARLPLVSVVDRLLAIADALDDASNDIVVWDAGEVHVLLEAIATLDAIPVVWAQSLPAFALSPGIMGEVGVRELTERIADALSRLSAAWFALVVSADAVAVIPSVVARADLMSLTVHEVIVNRVPRSADGWPKRWGRRLRADAKAVRHGSPLVIPWFTESDVDRRVARRVAKRLVVAPSGAPRAHTVSESSDGYAWRIPLEQADPASLRVGRVADAVVIEVAGLRRTIALPSVLVRCRIDGAGLIGPDLVIRFVPDPERWPRAS